MIPLFFLAVKFFICQFELHSWLNFLNLFSKGKLCCVSSFSFFPLLYLLVYSWLTCKWWANVGNRIDICLPKYDPCTRESLVADYWETSKALRMLWSTKMCQNSAPENKNEKQQVDDNHSFWDEATSQCQCGCSFCYLLASHTYLHVIQQPSSRFATNHYHLIPNDSRGMLFTVN